MCDRENAMQSATALCECCEQRMGNRACNHCGMWICRDCTIPPCNACHQTHCENCCIPPNHDCPGYSSSEEEVPFLFHHGRIAPRSTSSEDESVDTRNDISTISGHLPLPITHHRHRSSPPHSVQAHMQGLPTTTKELHRTRGNIEAPGQDVRVLGCGRQARP